MQSEGALRDVFQFRYFFLGCPTNRRGLDQLPDQSPATVVQDITHTLLPGYRYQATTFDPCAPSNPHCPAHTHRDTASHCPEKLPLSLLHVSLWPCSNISTQIPKHFLWTAENKCVASCSSHWSTSV